MGEVGARSSRAFADATNRGYTKQSTAQHNTTQHDNNNNKDATQRKDQFASNRASGNASYWENGKAASR